MEVSVDHAEPTGAIAQPMPPGERGFSISSSTLVPDRSWGIGVRDAGDALSGPDEIAQPAAVVRGVRNRLLMDAGEVIGEDGSPGAVLLLE